MKSSTKTMAIFVILIIVVPYALVVSYEFGRNNHIRHGRKVGLEEGRQQGVMAMLRYVIDEKIYSSEDPFEIEGKTVENCIFIQVIDPGSIINITDGDGYTTISGSSFISGGPLGSDLYLALEKTLRDGFTARP